MDRFQDDHDHPDNQQEGPKKRHGKYAASVIILFLRIIGRALRVDVISVGGKQGEDYRKDEIGC